MLFGLQFKIKVCCHNAALVALKEDATFVVDKMVIIFTKPEPKDGTQMFQPVKR